MKWPFAAEYVLFPIEMLYTIRKIIKSVFQARILIVENVETLCYCFFLSFVMSHSI